jgi:hypothetical protein
LLLVRGLSALWGIGLDILDVCVVLHHNVELVFLEQVQEILHKVDAVKEAQTFGQADAKVVVPLDLLLHEGLVVLHPLVIILSLWFLRRKGTLLAGCHSAGHDQLFDVLLMYLYAIHPHTAFLGKGFLNMNQTSLPLLHEVVHHFGYLYLRMGIWLALLLLLLRGDLMYNGVSLLMAKFDSGICASWANAGSDSSSRANDWVNRASILWARWWDC